MNTFGVDDADLVNYMQLLNADIQDTIIANKTFTASGAATAKRPVADLEQTRVEKMADMSVINELKQEQELPDLEGLDKLVMNKCQLNQEQKAKDH